LPSGSFPLKCLKCGNEFQEKVGRLETDPQIPCPACGVVTRYDAEELRAKMRGIDDALDEFRRKMGDFGKT